MSWETRVAAAGHAELGAAWLSLEPSPTVYEGHTTGDTSVLRVGAEVRVWQMGAVLESCPSQTQAAVVIVDR